MESLFLMDSIDKVFQRYAEILEKQDRMDSFTWYKDGENIFATLRRPLVGEDPVWHFFVPPQKANELVLEFSREGVGIATGDDMKYVDTIDDFIYEVVWDRLYGMRIR